MPEALKFNKLPTQIIHQILLLHQSFTIILQRLGKWVVLTEVLTVLWWFWLTSPDFSVFTWTLIIKIFILMFFLLPGLFILFYWFLFSQLSSISELVSETGDQVKDYYAEIRKNPELKKEVKVRDLFKTIWAYRQSVQSVSEIMESVAGIVFLFNPFTIGVLVVSVVFILFQITGITVSLFMLMVLIVL